MTLRLAIEQLYAQGRIVAEAPGDVPEIHWQDPAIIDGRLPAIPPSRSRAYACVCLNRDCPICWRRYRTNRRKRGLEKLKTGRVPNCECGECVRCRANESGRTAYARKKGGLLAGRRQPTMANLGEGGQNGESVAC